MNYVLWYVGLMMCGDGGYISGVLFVAGDFVESLIVVEVGVIRFFGCVSTCDLYVDFFLVSYEMFSSSFNHGGGTSAGRFMVGKPSGHVAGEEKHVVGVSSGYEEKNKEDVKDGIDVTGGVCDEGAGNLLREKKSEGHDAEDDVGECLKCKSGNMQMEEVHSVLVNLVGAVEELKNSRLDSDEGGICRFDEKLRMYIGGMFEGMRRDIEGLESESREVRSSLENNVCDVLSRLDRLESVMIGVSEKGQRRRKCRKGQYCEECKRVHGNGKV